MSYNELTAYSELADAAYGNLNAAMGVGSLDYIEALTEVGFASEKAKDFANSYRVVAVSPDITESGFQGIVFQNLQTGEYIISTRGTEFDSLDFTEDLGHIRKAGS